MGPSSGLSSEAFPNFLTFLMKKRLKKTLTLSAFTQNQETFGGNKKNVHVFDHYHDDGNE
jgi:hypothetical protein